MAHHGFFGHSGHQDPPPPVTQHTQHGHTGAAGGPYTQPGPTGGGGPYHQEPVGPLLYLCCAANPNYRLTSRTDGVVLAYKNQQDPKQYWIKVDYGDKFVDAERERAFILVSKATGQALSHGMEIGAAVTQEPYISNAIDNSVLWSQGRDLGKGFCAIRVVTNIDLNLDADHGDKKHGGVQEGNRLVVHTWNKQDNQKWMIAPVGPED